MPTFLATAMANAGWIATSSIATAATVISYAALATSVAYSQNQQKKARRAASDMASRGREFSISNTDTPRSLIVGRASIPIERMVYMDLYGDRNERYVFVAAFGGHEIDAIEDILFNGESIGPLDNDYWVNAPESHPAAKYVNRKFQMGAMRATWPGPGGIIDLPHDDIRQVYQIMSVAVVTIQGESVSETIIPEGSGGWTLQAGTPNKVLAGSGSGAFQGQEVYITYREQIRRPLVRAVPFVGKEAGERDTDLEDMSAGRADAWTASDVGHGVPRVRFELVWDANVWGPIGFPDIRFVVRGAKIPSFAGGPAAWSNNAARVIAWFLRRPEGFNALATDIDTTLAAAAQNACDETVPYEDGTKNQPRYTCDGVIDTEANPIDTLRDLLGSMAGRAVPVGGKWDLYAGVAQTPTFTLTDDDLASGEEFIRPESTLKEMVNCVRGRFVDRDKGYIVNDSPLYKSSTYLAADENNERWLEVDLPYTNNVFAAQRIMRLMLHKSRLGLAWSSKYAFGAHGARAGMAIRAQHSENGWSDLDSGAGKRLLIDRHSKSYDGTIDLVMREDSPDIYAWDFNEAVTPDPAPNTTLPDPSYVEPIELTRITSDAASYDVGTDGQKVPYVLLEWTALSPIAATEASYIEIEWKGASELSFRQERLQPDQTSVKLRPVFGGMLIAGQARVVNGVGAASAWAFFDHRASMDLPGNQQAVSANLLMNPTFKGGVKGWTLGIEAGATDNIYFRKPVTQIIPGTPTQVRIEQAGSENKHAVLTTPRISVIGGRRYCGYADCLGSYARTRVQASFYDAAGQIIDASAYGNMIEPAAPGTSLANPGNYRNSEFFADAPANAASAIFWLVKFGTINHTASWGDFYRPFFGEVPSGSTQRPPWDPGGLPSIYTDQLEINAATEIFAPTVADLDVEKFTPPYVSRQIISFVPSVSGDVEITIQASARSKAESGHTYTLLARVAGDNLAVKPGQTVAGSSWKEVHVVPNGAAVASTFIISATFGVTAGVACSIRLYLARGPVMTSVSAGGSVTVNPTGASIPQGADKAFAISPRITYVKA